MVQRACCLCVAQTETLNFLTTNLNLSGLQRCGSDPYDGQRRIHGGMSWDIPKHYIHIHIYICMLYVFMRVLYRGNGEEHMESAI